MPCRSDDYGPTSRQEESQRVCELLVYVARWLGQYRGADLPPHVAAAAENVYGHVATLNSDTELLCRWLNDIEAVSDLADKVIYDGRNAEARKLADWWQRHQEADRLRAEREREDAERATAKASALAKLTPEERKALGHE